MNTGISKNNYLRKKSEMQKLCNSLHFLSFFHWWLLKQRKLEKMMKIDTKESMCTSKVVQGKNIWCVGFRKSGFTTDKNVSIKKFICISIYSCGYIFYLCTFSTIILTDMHCGTKAFLLSAKHRMKSLWRLLDLATLYIWLELPELLW